MKGRAPVRRPIRRGVRFTLPFEQFFAFSDRLRPALDARFNDWSIDVLGGDQYEIVSYAQPITVAIASDLMALLRKRGAKSVSVREWTLNALRHARVVKRQRAANRGWRARGELLE